MNWLLGGNALLVRVEHAYVCICFGSWERAFFHFCSRPLFIPRVRVEYCCIVCAVTNSFGEPAGGWNVLYPLGEPSSVWDRFFADLEDFYWEDYGRLECCIFRRSRPYRHYSHRSWCLCKFKKGRFARSFQKKWRLTVRGARG